MKVLCMHVGLRVAVGGTYGKPKLCLAVSSYQCYQLISLNTFKDHATHATHEAGGSTPL